MSIRDAEHCRRAVPWFELVMLYIAVRQLPEQHDVVCERADQDCACFVLAC